MSQILLQTSIQTILCKMRNVAGNEAEVVFGDFCFFCWQAPWGPTGFFFSCVSVSRCFVDGKRQNEGHVSFCLCRSIRHGATPGPSLAAAHQLITAKAVFLESRVPRIIPKSPSFLVVEEEAVLGEDSFLGVIKLTCYSNLSNGIVRIEFYALHFILFAIAKVISVFCK